MNNVLRESFGRRTVIAMSKGLGLVAAALMAATTTITVAAAAPDADAVTPGCVSHREFEQVAGSHFTMRRVHRIFETRGVPVEVFYSDQIRHYSACGDERSEVGAHFKRVDGKLRLYAAW